MVIGDAELKIIGEYVRSNLRAWIDQLGVRPPPDRAAYGQLMERVFQVEAELKAGWQVIYARCEAMDKRFEDRQRAYERKQRTYEKAHLARAGASTAGRLPRC